MTTNLKRRHRPPAADAVGAVARLTVDDLDDDTVMRVGVLRAVIDLCRRTATAHGGIPGRWSSTHDAYVSHVRRLVADADAVWTEDDDILPNAS